MCITDSWTVLILHEMNVPACGSVSFVFMFWLINGKPNIRCYTTLTIKKILRHSLNNTECAAGNGHHALFQTTTTTTANLGTPRGLEPRLVLLPKGEVVTITGILNHVIYIYSRNLKKIIQFKDYREKTTPSDKNLENLDKNRVSLITEETMLNSSALPTRFLIALNFMKYA